MSDLGTGGLRVGTVVSTVGGGPSQCPVNASTGIPHQSVPLANRFTVEARVQPVCVPVGFGRDECERIILYLHARKEINSAYTACRGSESFDLCYTLHAITDIWEGFACHACTAIHCRHPCVLWNILNCILAHTFDC